MWRYWATERTACCMLVPEGCQQVMKTLVATDGYFISFLPSPLQWKSWRRLSRPFNLSINHKKKETLCTIATSKVRCVHPSTKEKYTAQRRCHPPSCLSFSSSSSSKFLRERRMVWMRVEGVDIGRRSQKNTKHFSFIRRDEGGCSMKRRPSPCVYVL